MKNMKTNFLFLLLIFTCFTQLAFGQIQTDTITAEEASQLIGEQIIIRAKVASVFYAKNSSGSPTFLNLDKNFPDNPIAVVIFEKELKKFKINAHLYKGKTVIVTGKVGLYKDEEKPNKNKSSIVIYSKDQIKIADIQ